VHPSGGKRGSILKKGRKSCINTFFELKACMWKYFIPPSFRITKEQQVRIENFIDIGDAFIQNLAKFSRLEKDFKHNLDLLLSEQRKRVKHKKEQAKFKKLKSMKRKEKKKSLRSFVLKKNKRTKR